MFRVNQTEWINPRLKGVEHVEIKEHEEDSKAFFYVDISTKDGDSYSSEYFDTFEDAEDYVKNLIDELN